jgi:hypothetical protein
MGTTMLGSFLSFCSKWYLQVNTYNATAYVSYHSHRRSNQCT